jgi:dihydroneopterin aldolase
MNDKILLYGAQFHGRHGVSPAEREIGGRYVVDIEIECDTRRAARLDDLADTVNYSDVFRTIRAVMEGEQFKLLETLAEKIAQTLLGKFPADAVRVRVKK